MHAFLKAAEGIRTLDLLHGKQNVQYRFAHEKPCKPRGLPTVSADHDSPAFTGSSREFRHPMGTRACVIAVAGFEAAASRLVPRSTRDSRLFGPPMVRGVQPSEHLDSNHAVGSL
jgi:hypothetical protein